MKHLLFLPLLLLCLSCTKTDRISQLTFNNTLTSAYVEDMPFSGEAWSEDGKTICMTCENGKITTVKVYHENGVVAIEGTSLVDASRLCNDQGQEISAETFKESYPRLLVAIDQMVHTMYCNTKLK